MDTRDHSGATARMLARQYGHMKIVGLIDAHSPSLPKSLYRGPGSGVCSPASAGAPSSPWAEEGGAAQLRLGGQVGGRRAAQRGGSGFCSLTLLWRLLPGRCFSFVSSSLALCRLELLPQRKEMDVCPQCQVLLPDWILSLLGVYNGFIYCCSSFFPGTLP